MTVKASKIFSVLLCILCLASARAAWADEKPLGYDAYSFSFAIKGGISLGSYESGMNWFFIEKLRQRSQRLRQEGRDGNILKVITGASAGGINAIVSAIRFCQQDSVPAQISATKNNLFYRVWDVELAKLLPEVKPQATPQPTMVSKEFGFDDHDGVFHRAALLGSLRAVLQAMQAKNFRNGCTTHIALPITLLKDHHQTTNDQPPTLRYAVPLQVTVDQYSLKFSNFAKASNSLQDSYADFHKLDDFMYLPEKSDGSVAYKDVLKLALASSAFPLAFAPMKLHTCLPDRQGFCAKAPVERTFIDGGSLDNAPIGLANRLSNYLDHKRDKAAKTIVVYLNPAHQSATLSAWLKKPDKNPITSKAVEPSGLQNYAKFLGDFFNYGMNAQYISSIRTGGMPPMPPRHYMLTADHLLHFGAFTLPSFRKFDFYVGMYDAYSAYQNIFPHDSAPNCKTQRIKWQQVPQLSHLFSDLARLEKEPSATFCKNPETISFYSDKKRCSKHNQGNALATIACALCKASQTQSSSTIEQFDQLKKHLRPCDQKRLNETFGNFGEHHLLQVFTAKQLTIEQRRLQQMTQQDSRYAQQKNFTRAVKAVNLISRTLSYHETHGLWPRSTSAHAFLHVLPDEIGIDGLNAVPYVNYHFDYPVLRGVGQASKWKGSSLALALSLDPFHGGRDNRNTSPYTALAIAPRLHLDSPLLSSVSIGINNYYNWKPALAGNRLWDHGLYFDAGVLTDKLHLTIIQRETLSSFKKVRFTFLIGIRDIGGLLDMMSDNNLSSQY